MKSLDKKTFGTTRYITFPHSLLFCCFFLYIWLFNDTRLIYHAFGQFMDYPFFFTGWEFLGNTIDHPGGIVEYITGFLSQFYYYPLAGAIVITLVVSLTCLAVAVLIRIAGFNYLPGFVAYTPAIFFLAMHNKFQHPLAVFVPLLINLCFLIVYEKIRLQRVSSRCCLFLVVFIVLYYVAGASALLFGILAAGYEIFIRRQFLLGMACILLSGVLPWVIGWCFDLRLMDIYLHLLPFDESVRFGAKTSAKALYVSVPCIVLAGYVCQLLLGFRPKKQVSNQASSHVSKKTSKHASKRRHKKSAGKTSVKSSGFAKMKRLRWVVQPLVVLVVVLAAIATVFLSTGIEKKQLQANFYSSNSMWTELLEHVDRFPILSYDPVISHNIIQTLYHTDRLGADLYSYPTLNEALFLPARKRDSLRTYIRGIRFIRQSLLLGSVNLAEIEAYEMLENFGDIPELLWNIAIINIAKDQPETARVFLEVLSRDLIYGRKAKNTLKLLDKDPQLSSDEEIIRIRSVMRKIDTTDTESLEIVLLGLLEANKHNKIAFEYLMINYLKGRQVGKIVENISRFKDFGYEKIPRHYEEAIILHMGKTEGKVNLHGWKIDPETVKQSTRFVKSFKSSAGNQLMQAKNLSPDFGNTYFFYYTFNRSGVGR